MAHATELHDDHGAAHGGAHAGPHHGPRHYVNTWIILLVLLVISIAGPMLGIKAVTLITAFGIAIVKAWMVAARFMHLNIEKKYVTLLLLTMIGAMFIFWFAVAPDIMKHDGTNWENAAAKAYQVPPPIEGHGQHAEGGSEHGSGHGAEPAPGH